VRHFRPKGKHCLEMSAYKMAAAETWDLKNGRTLNGQIRKHFPQNVMMKRLHYLPIKSYHILQRNLIFFSSNAMVR
jgi:hypothetical protein